MATTLKTLSQLPTPAARKSRLVKRAQLLSKSMEKTFRRYQTKPGVRQAFVEAEAATFLAHQIRVLRTERGWTQRELAGRLGTTQGVVSRLEDPSYGRIGFKTMVDLARVFDVAPVLKFMSTVSILRERWVIDRESMRVPSFEEEAMTVAFFEPSDLMNVAIGGMPTGRVTVDMPASDVLTYVDVAPLVASGPAAIALTR